MTAGNKILRFPAKPANSSAVRATCLALLAPLLLAACLRAKELHIEVRLADFDPSLAVLELDDALLRLGFEPREIPEDLALGIVSTVDRAYRHSELRDVRGTVGITAENKYLMLYLSEVSPDTRASLVGKELLWNVFVTVESIYGAGNVRIVEAHKSLE